MIRGRISRGGRTTIPIEVRTALSVGSGELISYEIDKGQVTLGRFTASNEEPSYSCFLEWSSAADSKAYANL